jgi:hypothetical protein
MYYDIESILLSEKEEARRQAYRAAARCIGPGDKEEDDEEEGVEIVRDEVIAAAWDEALLSY